MKSKKSHKKLIVTLIIIAVVLAVLIGAFFGIRRLITGDTKYHSVSSVAELYAMDSEKNYRLACDLDLQGQYGNMLRVRNFDGDGHTISNAVVLKSGGEDNQNGYGFFSTAQSITNVTFKNMSVTLNSGDVSCSAIVCGNFLKNAENVSVTDSSLNVTVNAGSSSYAHIGCITGSVYNCRFKNCTVKNCRVTVQQTNDSNGWLQIGGIVGDTSNNVSGCVVENTEITCQTRSYFNVGGIVGEMKPINDAKLENCIVRNNKLKIDSSANNKATRFGGLIGNADNEKVEIENCASLDNKMEIRANNCYNLAPFIGRNAGTVKNCLSDGNAVTASINNEHKDAGGYSSGFCGSNYGNISRCVAQNCTVTGTQSVASNGYIASGFAGYINASVAYCGVVDGSVDGGKKFEIANNEKFIINCKKYDMPSGNIISDLNLDAELWTFTDKLILNIVKEN